MDYYLHYNPDTGAVVGAGVTPDKTFPKNTIPCTLEQKNTRDKWRVDLKTRTIAPKEGDA